MQGTNLFKLDYTEWVCLLARLFLSLTDFCMNFLAWFTNATPIMSSNFVCKMFHLCNNFLVKLARYDHLV